MIKTVGIVTEVERDEIEEIYDKKIALENLLNAIDESNEGIYNKIITDYTETISKFNKWWDLNSKKYNWDGSQWSINFETREILIQE